MSAAENIGPETDYYRQERREMLRFVPEIRRRVLEIGCGEGNFIASIQGCKEKWGVEPTVAALKAAPKLTSLLRGTFDEVKHQLMTGYYDVIICNDVIEHMADHRGFLEQVKSYLRPGGMLIGSLPNVCFYDNLFRAVFDNDWRYTDSGVLDRTHLAFFTTKSFRRVLEETGYNVVQIQGTEYDCRLSDDRKGGIYRLAAKILGRITLGRLSHLRHQRFAFQATRVGDVNVV